ncbi:insulin-like growth factor-binding protein complex acid labile subunit isoform X2 [Toxorhynchites rutilus septentrionalis]|uniref:insulin-like growth factor-binding protein complex acid labile subunit isoform X2 n=1 Tax=Toxorhynchites rutilus septentrionalis TaxID=329112 RepID=UPI0024784FC0|nr:insulin-like growth factor-binding protein complex acid labile subunit isoform X2 [Toxorhynchites rutilus septentrionalis]
MFGWWFVIAVLGTLNVSPRWNSVSAERRNAADIELNEEHHVVSMKACYVEDLRNIREYNQSPLTVLINHCYLQELPNAIFIRFADLNTLEICDSRLNNLQDFALNGLRNLEVLNFSRNNLTTIKSWSDHNLERLQTLDLRRNLLKGINAESFRRYPNLVKLNLAANLIESIPEGTFKVVPNLKHLNLGRNLLTSIEETTLKGLSKLAHVSFHHNQIKFVDFFAFVGNSHLKTLQLQGNQISVFETDLLSNLPRLALFNISDNRLDNLAENTFKKNADLRVLDLSYNNIEVIHEDSLKGLASLEVFNASHNQLNKLNKYMFKDFSAVRILDLSGNRLPYIENKLFEYSPRLEVLNLSRNAITEIEPNIFEDCHKMHSLDLSHNQLQEDAFLWPIIELQHLNMSHNKFHRLNTSFLEGVEQVELYGNPWSCRFLVLELMKHGKNVRYGRNYVVQTRESILNAAGIECTDEEGKLRDFVMVESAPKADYSSSEYHRYKFFHDSHQDTRPIQDNFDTKSTILWLMSGVFLVFGAFKLIQLILRQSEHQSEKWRLAQHLEEFNEADEIDDNRKFALPVQSPVHGGGHSQ